jgi:hypothetical protein
MDANAGGGIGHMAAKLETACELVDIGAKTNALDNAFDPDLFGRDSFCHGWRRSGRRGFVGQPLAAVPESSFSASSWAASLR